MYYFAYGSNMNIAQMRLRCPGAISRGYAALVDWRLVERCYADIDEAPGYEVNGVLWEINHHHLRLLDQYEGYPHLYQRQFVPINHVGHIDEVVAITYQMTPLTKHRQERIMFDATYALGCLEGQKENNVPTSSVYLDRSIGINEVKATLTGKRLKGRRW